MGKYWNEEIECMPRGQMKKLQDERLAAQVKHVWDNVKKALRPMTSSLPMTCISCLFLLRLICARLTPTVCSLNRSMSA